MEIAYKNASHDNLAEIHELVAKVFSEFISPGYTEEGIHEFFKYIDPAALENRMKSDNHFTFIALNEKKVIGVIEIRDNNHVSLLFVDSKYQGKGIATQLFSLALEKCKNLFPELKEISVNSSPNAVSIYEKLGFDKTKEEQIKNGILFTPMTFFVRQ